MSSARPLQSHPHRLLWSNSRNDCTIWWLESCRITKFTIRCDHLPLHDCQRVQNNSAGILYLLHTTFLLDKWLVRLLVFVLVDEVGLGSRPHGFSILGRRNDEARGLHPLEILRLAPYLSILARPLLPPILLLHRLLLLIFEFDELGGVIGVTQYSFLGVILLLCSLDFLIELLCWILDLARDGAKFIILLCSFYQRSQTALSLICVLLVAMRMGSIKIIRC